MMERALSKRKARGWDVTFDEAVLYEIKESVARANDASEDFTELIDQKVQEEY